ncbi:recombinase RecT [Komagataeibacter intermedius]|uniref:Recombinational DNA repair protein n=1 Tax=Komagataeibacter intermedius NRIC 0521 TaxID=1307934 RepID=A0ABQ0PGR3_9PROT|nr:recombinase RecT [Komagataeibacter intermedius]GAN86390.1 single-stranded DNA binding/complementary single-stranded DNA renaturating protein RecT [Komagataeibacter intermedius TF2]GBQ68078.1 recombinational DNA repair protein [Komagataeibacter intermedius NRIC 0521]
MNNVPQNNYGNRSPARGRLNGQTFAAEFAKIMPQVKAVLPAHISVDKFERVVRIAVQKNDKLLECSPRSLFMECVKAASDGLLPDGREGAIVPRGSEAVWQPMVSGLMKLARNSGQIASISSQVVYKGERFRVVLGDDERIEHERDLDIAGETEIVAAYAVARLKDGSEPIREIMTWKQIEKVRNTNKYWMKGPWKDWGDEMARKTVIRRLSKRLPFSTDQNDERLQEAIQRTDALVDLIADPEPTAQEMDPFEAAAHGVDPAAIENNQQAVSDPITEKEQVPA